MELSHCFWISRIWRYFNLNIFKKWKVATTKYSILLSTKLCNFSFQDLYGNPPTCWSMWKKNETTMMPNPLKIWSQNFLNFHSSMTTPLSFDRIVVVFIMWMLPSAMSAILTSEVRRPHELVCTSEREVCLPANYSKFQLPNKGRQTTVSIGKNTFCLCTVREWFGDGSGMVWG